MAKENESLDFRLKIDETRNYLLDEIKHNDLMSEKQKKVCRALNYFEHFVIFICVLSDFASIYAFASLVSVPVGIASSAFGLKVCVKTAGIKYKSITTKKKKKV